MGDNLYDNELASSMWDTNTNTAIDPVNQAPDGYDSSGGYQGPIEEGKEWDSLNPPPRFSHPNPYMTPFPEHEDGFGGDQGYQRPPNPDPNNPFMQFIDGQWVNTKGWQSQSWGVQGPQHDTGGWGGDMDVNQIREKLYPDMPPPRDDYTMAEQLRHGFNRTMFPEQGNFKNWWRNKGPKLTRTSKGYLPDGSPALGPEGEQLTREQIMRLQSPITARRLGPEDSLVDYNPLERAFNMDFGFQSPMVGTDQSRFPSGQTPYRRVEHPDTFEEVTAEDESY